MTKTHDYEQGRLLDHRDHDGIPIVAVGESFAEGSDQQTGGSKRSPRYIVETSGAFVNLASRAEALVGVIEALSERNQSAGLSKVAPYKKDIQERYGKNKAKEARQTAKDLLEEARQHFWKAYGHKALKNADIVSPENLELDMSFDELDERVAFKDLDVDTRMLWSEFQRQYSQPGAAAEKKRRAFIDQLG